MSFREVSQISELDELFTQSAEQPVILFKHSLTCPISHAAYEEMSLLNREEVALVVVQDARPVSNEIANRTGIKHESPQAFIVKDGEVTWHSSHYDITKSGVMRALEEARG
jgi:bacillithiol system protein YtxJ